MNRQAKKIKKDDLPSEWNCPVCEIKCDSRHSFTLHIRQHNPTDHSHTCSICSKTLSSASSLDRHMLIHSGERPFKCKKCNMTFTTNGNMHRHMRTHGIESNENDAPRNDNNNNHTKNLINNNNGSNNNSLNTSINIPIESHENEKEQFLAMLQLFPKNRMPIVNTSKLDNPIVNSPSSLFFREEKSNFDYPSYFLDAYMALNRLDDNNNNIPSPISDSNIPSNNDSLVESKVNHLKASLPKFNGLDDSRLPYHCDICVLDFKSYTALKRHNRGHTKSAHTKKGPIKSDLFRKAPFDLAPIKSSNSDLIGKKSPSIESSLINKSEPIGSGFTKSDPIGNSLIENGLARKDGTKSDPNKRGHTKSGTTKSGNTKSGSTKSGHSKGDHNYACNLCSYTSLDKSTLVRHLRTHNGERPFQCAICKYAFTTKANCERHVRKRHKKLSKQEIKSVMLFNDGLTTSSPTSAAIISVPTLTSVSQPLDLAVHALDLSCKPSSTKLTSTTNPTIPTSSSTTSNNHRLINNNIHQSLLDLHTCSEPIRSAASSLLALQSFVPNPNSLLLMSLNNDSLQFHSSASPLTGGLLASSSSSLSSSLSSSPSSSSTILTAQAITNQIAKVLSPNATASKGFENLCDKTMITTQNNNEENPKNFILSKHSHIYTCRYCSSGFTLKSNMERHIKRKHPQYVRAKSSQRAPSTSNKSPSSSPSPLFPNTTSNTPTPLQSKS